MSGRREYITEQLSIIAGAPVALTDAQVDCFWPLLTRAEERNAPVDEHGKFSLAGSILALDGRLERPPLHDEIAVIIAASAPAMPRWPRGHRFAACLTHDVDRIVVCPWRERLRQYAALRGSATPSQIMHWGAAFIGYGARALVGAGNRAPYDFWLEEEDRRGFHSTFYILPERLEQCTPHDHYYRYRDRVMHAGRNVSFAEATRKAHDLGWEIGLHGSYLSAFNETILRSEKDQVENMLGHPVFSVRQHFLRFNVDVTPGIQARAGFMADSTLGYGNTIGCRAGMAFPYFWPEMDLLEIPLIIHDIALLRNSPRPHDLPSAIVRAEALIRRIAEVGGVVTLSWHTHPDSPGAHVCYRALLDTISNLNGWGCSSAELNAWWRRRRAALKSADSKLRTSDLRITI